MNNISAVVLAAGKGTRIGQKLPKALYPLAGKPMIHYAVDTLKKIPVEGISVVVGYRASDVKASIDKNINMVYQQEQLGTAHALKLALAELHPSIETVLVVNCDDSSFYEATTLRSFIKQYLSSNKPISLITHSIVDPTGLGRIVREDDEVVRIIEEKDASEAEKEINEINTGCFLINVPWAKQHLQNIKKSTQGEFYLTDLVEIALEMKGNVGTYQLENPGEWMAVNTPDELAKAHTAMIRKLKRMHMHTVVFVDIDNTLINTAELKKVTSEIMSAKLTVILGTEIESEDLDTKLSNSYEIVRDELGYIDIPRVSKLLAEQYNLPSSEPFIDIFFTLPFKNYLNSGAKELLEFLSRWSRVVVFGDGDLVYQPVKFNSLDLSGYYHDIYIAEKKSDIVEDLLNIYVPQKTIFIDDQVQNLENARRYDKDATTIHFRQGYYRDQQPVHKQFTADFEASSLNETLVELKKNVFKWT